MVLVKGESISLLTIGDYVRFSNRTWRYIGNNRILLNSNDGNKSFNTTINGRWNSSESTLYPYVRGTGSGTFYDKLSPKEWMNGTPNLLTKIEAEKLPVDIYKAFTNYIWLSSSEIESSTQKYAPHRMYYSTQRYISIDWANNSYEIRPYVTLNDSLKIDSGSGTSGSPYILSINAVPTITLNTTDNRTLYENDTLLIDGQATDTDADQSVTVYYQINNEPKKVLATNLSQITIPFNKQLSFKNGKLYDGETAISSTLIDGVAHTLKVWAQDSNGAESTITTRSFYVVPNRAPSLTIDAVVPSGNINSDKFSISGSAGDPDANANVRVIYRINNNNSIEVYNGPGGAFSFEVVLSQLIVGQNTIIVEVTDNYGAKYSKTIKLNKNEVKTPLLKSTARYKIEPPSGSVKGVLLWIQRSENLQIDAKISMGLVGEPENFVPMDYDKDENGEPDNVAPIPNTDLVEAEYYYEATEPKDNIILQIDMTRSSLEVSDVITLISGVLE